MSRPNKDSIPVNIKMDIDIAIDLNDYPKESGVPKTSVIGKSKIRKKKRLEIAFVLIQYKEGGFIKNNYAKKQHFIPQFYQKQWVYDSDKKVYCLDVKNKTIRNIPIIRNCQENYLYEYDKKNPTNYIEKELNKLETEYANIFQKQIPLLESGIKVKLSLNEEEILYRFIALSIIRTPYEMNLFEKHPYLKYFRIENELEEEFRRTISRAVLIFPEMSDIYKKIVSSNFKTFIISDDICYSEKIPYHVKNGELIFLAFPISPKLLIVFSKYDYGTKEKSNCALNIYYNYLFQTDYIYSNNKDILDMLIKELK